MSILLPLAAALVFTCDRPRHHDGDAIRCAGIEQSMRLHGIDAPEMPGACRPGRRCTPGDPYAARDHLRNLTQGRLVRCEELDVDSYGRPVVRCTADGDDISCAMVASGHAVERYGRLDCATPWSAGGGRDTAQAAPMLGRDPAPLPAPKPDDTAERAPEDPRPQDSLRPIVRDNRYFAPPGAQTIDTAMSFSWFTGGTWLVLVNLLGWTAMDTEKGRSFDVRRRGPSRYPSSLLLLLALAGGGPGMLAAQQVLGHRLDEQPFSLLLLLISGLEIGLVMGVVALAMT